MTSLCMNQVAVLVVALDSFMLIMALFAVQNVYGTEVTAESQTPSGLLSNPDNAFLRASQCLSPCQGERHTIGLGECAVLDLT